MASSAISEGVTPPSSLIRAHAPDQDPPAAFRLGFGWRVFAGCCRPLLGIGPSRRYLRVSFPGCLDLYPGGSRGAHSRCFPRDDDLPRTRSGSAQPQLPAQRLQGGGAFRDCSHSLTFRPPGLLSPRSLPPPGLAPRGSCDIFPPSRTHVVTFICIGFANRSNGKLTVRGLPPRQTRGLVGRSAHVRRVSFPARPGHGGFGAFCPVV